MVKLNLSVMTLIVMLIILSIIQLVPADNVFLPALYNFQKIMSYAFAFLLFHFVVGISLLAVYKAFKLVTTNKFVKVLFDFLLSFDDKSYQKLTAYISTAYGVKSFTPQ